MGSEPYKLITILNGPPGVGKDTIARHLVKQFAKGWVREYKFAKPLHAAAQVFGADDKDAAWHENGENGRQFRIAMSEEFMKPRYGQSIFGYLLAVDLVNNAHDMSTPIISDGGFAEEVEPLLNIAGNILIVQLSREGCTFDGDSRSYIDMNHPKVTTIGIHLQTGFERTGALRVLTNMMNVAETK